MTHQKPAKHIVRVQLIETSNCVFDELLSSSYPSLSVLPYSAFRPPTKSTHIYAHTYRYGAAVREIVFHLDLKETEAQV